MHAQHLAHLLDLTELRNIVALEIQQSQEEGRLVADQRARFDATTDWTRQALYELYEALIHAPMDPAFPYDEPESLEGIRAARPAQAAAVAQGAPAPTGDALYNLMHGAWLGRCVGCVLGKPIEANWSKDQVLRYLRLAKAEPLVDYIPRVVPQPEGYVFNVSADTSFRGAIDGAPIDDDTDYTLLGLHILETHGPAFAAAHVGAEWLTALSYGHVYTAEKLAYRNLALGLKPPETATLLNPAREWIGARIRADAYGMAVPGKPELAAELAYRDGLVAHTKNGIYSGMAMAAMLAWAFVADDPDEIVAAGLSVIPAGSRLAEAIRRVRDVAREVEDWETAYDRLMPDYATYHGVHAINNTVALVLAVLYGKGDFTRTVGIAVSCGLDTDCNGANAGAIVGAAIGAEAIPGHWREPLHDTLRTSLSGWEPQRISTLARRSVAVAEAFAARGDRG